MQLAKDGVRVDLDTGVLFAPGSAIIKKEALKTFDPLLRKIAKTDYLVDIEGHSDDVNFIAITKVKLKQTGVSVVNVPVV